MGEWRWRRIGVYPHFTLPTKKEEIFTDIHLFLNSHI